jgi:hypothetical protein
MSQLHLANYATPRFFQVRDDLTASARRHGVESIFSFEERDLHGTEFYLTNRNILDEICGAGLFAWKPFFILQALGKISEGDVLFYCDSGSLFLESPAPLIQLANEEEKGLVVFDTRPLSNSQFTKRDCFVAMECDRAEYWDAPQVIATILVMRKCKWVCEFMEEWLSFCLDRRCVSDDSNTLGFENLEGYLQHRWDQSILSLLVRKHRLPTFRNPSKWGNYLKMVPFRVHGEHVSSPYGIPPLMSEYSNSPQPNSHYGTLFEFNRLPNYVGKKPLEPFKNSTSFSARKPHWGGRISRKFRTVFGRVGAFFRIF